MFILKPRDPGSWIGILGGGQLGMMYAQAAKALGYRVAIYAPKGDNPAFHTADAIFEGPYSDKGLLKNFGHMIRLAISEFENVPLESLRIIESMGIPVRPGSSVFRVAQNRLHEKHVMGRLDVPMGPYIPIPQHFITTDRTPIERQMLLKSCSDGYDGKNQARVSSFDEVMAHLREKPRDYILEEIIPFAYEFSTAGVRLEDGTMHFFPSPTNYHEGGILRWSRWAPDNIDPAIEQTAQEYSRRFALHFNVVGMVTHEWFVTSNGRVLYNETAPRIHNSGHWTLDGCNISHATAHIYAATGTWPEGLTIKPTHAALMHNLLGDEIKEIRGKCDFPTHVRVHDYLKVETRPGRKMGHTTRLLRPV